MEVCSLLPWASILAPTRSCAVRIGFFGSEMMPSGERGKVAPIMTNLLPLATASRKGSQVV